MSRFVVALLLLAALLCAASAATVRCFVQEALPYAVDAVHTRFSYQIDTLDPEPLELTLPTLEWGPVLDDRCTWSPGHDLLMLFVNDVVAASYPTHCTDGGSLGFGVSTLGDAVWGDVPRSPAFGPHHFAPQNGRIDMRTARLPAMTAGQRLRNITLALWSGSRREFMPGAPQPPALVVRVCMLATRVPADWLSTAYTEVPADANTVYPMGSCVYARTGLCGAALGYASTAASGAGVSLRARSSTNHLVPSDAEAGWQLPSLFPAGVRLADSSPGLGDRWYVGWRCDSDAVHWHVNGSRLALDRLSPRCPDTMYATAVTERAEYGDRLDGVSPAQQPRLPTHEHKLTIEVARAYWEANAVAQPVLALAVQEEQHNKK